MNKIELFFEGTDFTPLVRNENGKILKTFKFSCRKDNKDFKGDLNSKNKRIIEITNIINDDEKQLDLLKKILIKSQENIDDLIMDKSLNDSEKLLFDYHSQKMYFGGLVGVFSIKDFEYNNFKYDITIQINTRFKKNNKKKDFLLMTLLFDGYVPLVGSDTRKDSEKMTDMLLLYSFIKKYEIAFIKGYYKTYHTKENNDSRVKGTLNIPRHISTNLGLNNGRITYSYKEKSEYNYINHLIIYAYDFLKTKYGNIVDSAFKDYSKLKESLDKLNYLIEYPKYSKREILNKTINNLRHPYYTEYEDLRKICLKILREEKISPFSGKENEKVEGILLYVPRLWENYIKKFFRNIRVSSQDHIRILDINDNNEYVQETIPDFVFYEDNNPFMILDAKFKPSWYDVATSGYLGDYLLSDYDKCIRDMISINAKATGVIFPTNVTLKYEDNHFLDGEKEYLYKHNISKYNNEHSFFTFPIYVPESSGEFNDWKKIFINNCNDIFSKITLIIQKQK